jgi:hypothetical protein
MVAKLHTAEQSTRSAKMRIDMAIAKPQNVTRDDGRANLAMVFTRCWGGCSGVVGRVHLADFEEEHYGGGGRRLTRLESGCYHENTDNL